MRRRHNLFKMLWWTYLEWLDSGSDDKPTERIMERYSVDLATGNKEGWHPNIVSITVRDLQTKDELIDALEYLHNGMIDTDYKMVNSLVHLYLSPEKINVVE